MAEITKSDSGGGATIPQLFKWIKLRTASKKDNLKSPSKPHLQQQQQHQSPVKATNGQHKLLYDKTKLVSRSSDNIHRITHAPLSPEQQVALSVLSNQPASVTNSLQKHSLKSESMVMLTSGASLERDGEEAVGDDSVQSPSLCRHGSFQRPCRSCMQLPPLPPGHERILRDHQRQERQRLKEAKLHKAESPAKNTPSSTTGQVATDSTAPTRTLPVPAMTYTTHPYPAQSQLKVPTNIVLQHNALLRVQSPLHRNSPEHIYEEIPSSFFRQTSSANTKAFPGSPRSPGTSENEYGFSDLTRKSCDFRRQVSLGNSVPTSSVQNTTCELSTAKSATIQADPLRSSSRQVSLGNLNFEMAKECDGFLVVPLRDKMGNTPGSQAGQYLQSTHQQQDCLSHSGHIDSSQTGAPIVGSSQSHHYGAVTVSQYPADANKQPVLSPNQTLHSVSSRVSHTTSDSGYQEQSQIVEPVQSTRHADTAKVHNTATVNQTVTSTHITAAENVKDKGFVHCRKCRRPHGVYHGISMCHATSPQDLRPDLQYLDIAGFEKRRQLTVSDVSATRASMEGEEQEESPFLLQNLAHRRSAFAKYIPVRRSDEDGEREADDEQVVSPIVPLRLAPRVHLDTDDAAALHLAVSTASADAYKRQSMSAESDYFSSNYNTSQSDTLSRGSNRASAGHHSQNYEAASNYIVSNTSERSNDTFSEYDITPTQEHLVGRLVHSDTTDDYEYYLAKAKHNNMLKSHVRQIIRSSESERSDVERGSSALPDDSTSLTSVTSLSEFSAQHCDDPIDRLSCRVHRSAASAQRTHRHYEVAKDKTPSPPAEGELFKNQTRTRKPIRKKRTKTRASKDGRGDQSDKMEYYRLPNFCSSASGSCGLSGLDSSDTVSVGSRGSVSSKRSDPSNQTLVSEEHAREHSDTNTPQAGESKLSCRVTDFKLSDIRRSGSMCSDLYTAPMSVASAKPGVPAVRDVMVTDTSQTSLYSRPIKPHHSSNNRLLNDLMRMNHDRQLFSLL